jgi:hypothetical protein
MWIVRVVRHLKGRDHSGEQGFDGSLKIDGNIMKACVNWAERAASEQNSVAGCREHYK